MITRFLSWLGLARRPIRGKQKRGQARRPSSATAHLFEKKKPAGGESGGSKSDNDFNPYNTGKFDRSASWDRISKTQR